METSGEPRAGSVELDALRQAFIDGQAVLEAASRDLREVLVQVEESTRVGRSHLLAGGSAVDLPVVADIAGLRSVLAQRLAAFDHARLETRTVNMQMAVWEGFSASEIARRYGVSRQYASKLISASRTDAEST